MDRSHLNLAASNRESRGTSGRSRRHRPSLPGPPTTLRHADRNLPPRTRPPRHRDAARPPIITSGRYLREFASGDAGPVFTFDRDPDLADLREWRSTAGLAEEPALAVVSRQLDFDWKAARRQSPAVIGIGSSDADAAVVSRLENEGIAVVLGSSRSGVTGSEIAEGLAALGHHTAFSSAGPHIAHLLFADNVLDRLYVTYVTTILGGRSYATLSEAAGLDSPFAMEPRSLYFDPAGANGGAQIFSSFDQR